MATTTDGAATGGNPFDEFPVENSAPQHTRFKSVPADLFASFVDMDPLLTEEAKQDLGSSKSEAPKPSGLSISAPSRGSSDSNENKHAPTKSLDISELRQIAAALAQEKPRCATEAEEAQAAADNHMLTLGESPAMSTGTKKSHRRKKSSDIFQSTKTLMKTHNPILSKKNTDSADNGNITADMAEDSDLDPTKKTRSLTPTRRGIKNSKMKSMMNLASVTITSGGVSPKKTSTSPLTGSPKKTTNPHSARLSPTKSPSKKSIVASPVKKRHSIASPKTTPTTARKKGEKTSGSNAEVPPSMNPSTANGLDMPDLAASEQHPGNNATADRSLRSSELDPSDFQVELPPAEEFLVHSRICAVLDSYPIVDQNFDFGALAGMSRMSLEAFAQRLPSMSMSPLSPPTLSLPSHMAMGSATPESSASSPPPLQTSFSSTSSTQSTPPQPPVQSAFGAQLVDSHRPIVNTVLECADDLVVEGFFHEVGDDERDESVVVGGDKSTHDRIEVAVFSSQKHRQFVVAYRGTTERQKKPVRNKQDKKTSKHFNASNLHEKHPVTVFPPFREAYFKKGLEEKVFDLLNNLSENNPFCDVVFTGHSFGGALATIGSFRYAIDHPMMRVSCHAFGSPRVGAQNFRDLVNSLPNLKVMRVEYGSDPWVFTPEGQTWTHVGQTIVLNSGAGTSATGTTSDRPTSSHHSIRNLRLNKDTSNSSGEKNDNATALAFKFDKGRKGGGGSSGLFKKKTHNKNGKADQEIRSYVQAIEQYTHLGLTWVKGYVGENVGAGVRGKGEETRLVC